MIKSITSFFSKRFKVIAIFGYITLFSTLVFFQIQKKNLREDITNITAQKESLKVSYESELERINTKHNQIIKNMINEEKYERIKKELEQERKQKEIETRKNKALKDKLEIVENKTGDKCLEKEIPQDLKDIL